MTNECTSIDLPCKCRRFATALDAVVQRSKDREERKQEAFRDQLTAYRNLYAFLSQIIPYQDTDLERFYAFVRNLLAKLPPRGGGQSFVLDDEVALKFFRLQQMSEGSIDLSEGESDPLKGPIDVGTGRTKDEEIKLSNLIDNLNERFGTDFTEADQLLFDQYVPQRRAMKTSQRRLALIDFQTLRTIWIRI